MRGRISRRAVPVVVLLTIALTLPEVKWCSLAWADVAPECFVVCVTPLPCPMAETSPAAAKMECDGQGCPRSMCGAAPASTLTTPGAADCNAADDESTPSASHHDSTPADSRGRAWFPADAPGGAAPRARAIETPQPAPIAILTPEPELEDDAVRWIGGPAPTLDRPPGPEPHARPPIRAPPAA